MFADQLSPYLDQKTDGFVESLYRKVLEVRFTPLLLTSVSLMELDIISHFDW